MSPGLQLFIGSASKRLGVGSLKREGEKRVLLFLFLGHAVRGRLIF